MPCKRYNRKKSLSFLGLKPLVLILLAIMSFGFKLDRRTVDARYTELCNFYLYDSLLFVSDMNKGISIYSVENPNLPVYKSTIFLDGNSGMAVKGNVVYANSFQSILAFRLNDDFTYDTLSVIVNKVQCGVQYIHHRRGFFDCGCFSDPVANDAKGTGTGGSYAKFAVIDTFLYYIDDSRLITVDISNPEKITELSDTYIDWSVETLFPIGKYIFIGGPRGMYVLDISNPEKPVKITTFEHFKAYDPVVVSGNIAYITLRGGKVNNENRNVLLSVDISDIRNPVLKDEVNISTPYGLTVKDSLLYVSNGINGMSLFNVTVPDSLRLVKFFQQPETKDFIWIENLLYIMGFNNIRILDVTDPLMPVELSVFHNCS